MTISSMMKLGSICTFAACPDAGRPPCRPFDTFARPRRISSRLQTQTHRHTGRWKVANQWHFIINKLPAENNAVRYVLLLSLFLSISVSILFRNSEAITSHLSCDLHFFTPGDASMSETGAPCLVNRIHELVSLLEQSLTISKLFKMLRYERASQN